LFQRCDDGRTRLERHCPVPNDQSRKLKRKNRKEKEAGLPTVINPTNLVPFEKVKTKTKTQI
jgi:hypothetical protein